MAATTSFHPAKRVNPVYQTGYGLGAQGPQGMPRSFYSPIDYRGFILSPSARDHTHQYMWGWGSPFEECEEDWQGNVLPETCEPINNGVGTEVGRPDSWMDNRVHLKYPNPEEVLLTRGKYSISDETRTQLKDRDVPPMYTMDWMNGKHRLAWKGPKGRYLFYTNYIYPNDPYFNGTPEDHPAGEEHNCPYIHVVPYPIPCFHQIWYAYTIPMRFSYRQENGVAPYIIYNTCIGELQSVMIGSYIAGNWSDAYMEEIYDSIVWYNGRIIAMAPDNDPDMPTFTGSQWFTYHPKVRGCGLVELEYDKEYFAAINQSIRYDQLKNAGEKQKWIVAVLHCFVVDITTGILLYAANITAIKPLDLSIAESLVTEKEYGIDFEDSWFDEPTYYQLILELKDAELSLEERAEKTMALQREFGKWREVDKHTWQTNGVHPKYPNVWNFGEREYEGPVYFSADGRNAAYLTRFVGSTNYHKGFWCYDPADLDPDELEILDFMTNSYPPVRRIKRLTFTGGTWQNFTVEHEDYETEDPGNSFFECVEKNYTSATITAKEDGEGIYCIDYQGNNLVVARYKYKAFSESVTEYVGDTRYGPWSEVGTSEYKTDYDVTFPMKHGALTLPIEDFRGTSSYIKTSPCGCSFSGCGCNWIEYHVESSSEDVYNIINWLDLRSDAILYLIASDENEFTQDFREWHGSSIQDGTEIFWIKGKPVLTIAQVRVEDTGEGLAEYLDMEVKGGGMLMCNTLCYESGASMEFLDYSPNGTDANVDLEGRWVMASHVGKNYWFEYGDPRIAYYVIGETYKDTPYIGSSRRWTLGWNGEAKHGPLIKLLDLEQFGISPDSVQLGPITLG
jgi:hypothetical protein